MLAENPLFYRLLVGAACLTMITAGIVVGTLAGRQATAADDTTTVESTDDSVAAGPATRPSASVEPTVTTSIADTSSSVTEPPPSTRAPTSLDETTSSAESTTTETPTSPTTDAQTSTTATTAPPSGPQCGGRQREADARDIAYFAPPREEANRHLIVVVGTTVDEATEDPLVCQRSDLADTGILVVRNDEIDQTTVDAVAQFRDRFSDGDVELIGYGNAATDAVLVACGRDLLSPPPSKIVALNPRFPLDCELMIEASTVYVPTEDKAQWDELGFEARDDRP